MDEEDRKKRIMVTGTWSMVSNFDSAEVGEDQFRQGL